MKEELKPKVGLYANQLGYSDVYPFEIISVNPSGKSIKVREVEAEKDPTWKPEWIAGGFSGHVLNNNSQRWLYRNIPDGEEAQELTLRKTGKGWSYKGRTFVISETPKRFYDYNF